MEHLGGIGLNRGGTGKGTDNIEGRAWEHEVHRGSRGGVQGAREWLYLQGFLGVYARLYGGDAWRILIF